MRVLIVHPGVPVYGGAEHVIVQFCAYLRRQGIDHTLLTNALPKGMATDLEGTPVEEVGGKSRVSAMAMLMVAVNRLARRYDVINAHNFPASFAALYSRKPVVWLCNEPPELFTTPGRRPLEALHRRRVKERQGKGLAVVVADKFNCHRFFDIYGVVPKVIPYGIDYDFFSHGANGRTRDKSRFGILQVGTFNEYKNQLATLDAAAIVLRRVPEMEVWMVGDNDNRTARDTAYLRRVESRVQELGLGGRVKFIGHKSREMVRNLMQCADVLMHPCGEQGGWLAPFEALSARLPVVVSPKLSAACMLSDNNLGYVTDNYARALLDVYDEPVKARTQSFAASAWVRENLSWDKFGDAMVETFEEVMRCERRSLSSAPVA